MLNRYGCSYEKAPFLLICVALMQGLSPGQNCAESQAHSTGRPPLRYLSPIYPLAWLRRALAFVIVV